MRKLNAYTDGSCKPNPGIGGWGWVIYDDTISKCPLTLSDYGGSKETTNQQMELTAMAELLETLAFFPRGIHVNVYSDSDYVLGGIVGQHTRELTQVKPEPQGWLRGWVNKRFVSGDTYSDRYWNKDVMNGYEWYRIHQALLALCRNGITINFCWVKGHSGVKGNEEADRLACLFKEEI